MTPLRLADLKSPEDLKGLDVDELEGLCAEMRDFLVGSVHQTGGHLGSNLGVVELVTALHTVFDFRRDRIVFDVGHQCYPHKILTGRQAGFEGLRQTGGLSGFCNRKESEYDLLTAGHAGTAISFALGLAEGCRGSAPPGEEDPWSVAFVGDAGFGAGVSFEGLTQAAERKARMLVILNDNEWSIARSVGAMARYLSRIRSSRTLQKTYDRLGEIAHKIPGLGSRMEELGEVIRHVLVPGHVFEELGVHYLGPLDGHDVGGAMEALERAKRLDGVTLLHFLTEKGKGFAPAADDPERAHGVSPQSKVPSPVGQVAEHRKMGTRSWTSVFGDEAVALAKKDSRVHAITAGMPSGTGLSKFSETFPGRFHDTGITEQHAVALSGGMATAGLRPLVAIYSTFLQRGYDQVFQEVALQKENVVFCMDRAGLVGQDGPTHMGLYDLAYLRALPGIQLASPRDAIDLGRMLQAAVEAKGPWALRWPRDTAPDSLGPPEDLRLALEPGVAEKLREGEDGAVFALGAMVEEAMEAARLLEEDCGFQLEVWDARFCAPLDKGALAHISRRHPWLAAVEDHSLCGGFTAAVAETLADLGCDVKLHRFGVPDLFVEHMSTRREQMVAFGLTAPLLAEEWRKRVEESREAEPAPRAHA